MNIHIYIYIHTYIYIYIDKHVQSHDAMVKTWVNNSASGELSSIHGYGVISFYSVPSVYISIYTYPIYTQYNNDMVFYICIWCFLMFYMYPFFFRVFHYG